MYVKCISFASQMYIIFLCAMEEKGNKKTGSYIVRMEPELHEKAVKKAKQDQRSFSAYVRLLITKDTETKP